MASDDSLVQGCDDHRPLALPLSLPLSLSLSFVFPFFSAWHCTIDSNTRGDRFELTIFNADDIVVGRFRAASLS